MKCSLSVEMLDHLQICSDLCSVRGFQDEIAEEFSMNMVQIRSNALQNQHYSDLAIRDFSRYFLSSKLRNSPSENSVMSHLLLGHKANE